ncbi:hypothetical protein [Pseudopelagicola sp. nBUS_19]|uniref:hypothetical protein n=1 Tax=Pseudopelagicola sp. nBUS_19 TaxID=3395316 RepID=UPI003EB93893
MLAAPLDLSPLIEISQWTNTSPAMKEVGQVFSMPKSFSDLVIKSIRTLPYVAVLNGTIFALIGLYMIWSASAFSSRAVETELAVVLVESKRSDNGQVYRPTFEALTAQGEARRYTGNTWVSPKPHSQGEVVQGLVDWSSGEIRSTSMIEWSKSFGRMIAFIGGVCFLLGATYLWYKRRKQA